MKSFVPYQFSAALDWITDNHWTPHIVVLHQREGVVLPPGATGEVTILSISASAVKHFTKTETGVEFQARLWGKECYCVVPFSAIGAIYPKEQPHLQFQMPVETTIDRADKPLEPAAETTPPRGAHLRVVK